MSVIINGSELRSIGYGRFAEKSITQAGAGTQTVFNVTGGRVLLTSISGIVTTAVTTAGTTQLQSNPSAAAGTTSAMCTATDLGTTDTPAGDVLGLTAPGSAITRGGVVQILSGSPYVIPAGAIEHVVATGGDGTIKWTVTWIPLDDGAALAAA